MKKQWLLSMVLILVLAGLLSACGSNNEGSAGSDGEAAKPATVKIGLLKNVTHAPAFIAIKNGYFQKAFGDDVKIEVQAFDNGSDFSTAMATGQIDIGYVGPGPVTNQYVRSKNITIVSGANNGGAVLVTRKGANIAGVKGLAGKTAAIPTTGSTNEISLRLLLQQNGLSVTKDVSGVQLITMAPADTLVAMKQNQVDAALLPEPWGTQIVEQGIGDILVDWDKIPPNDGNYPLTILVANNDFLKKYRGTVKEAIQANIEAIDYIKSNPDDAYSLVSDELKELSGKGLELNLIKAALQHLILTTDIDLDVLEQMAQVAVDAGYIKDVEGKPDLSGLLDLSILEEVKS